MPARSFYDPTVQGLDLMGGHQWVVAFSGGKDSTALVTWLEWLRRAGWVDQPHPQLVMSDTGVEFPFLTAIAHELMHKLAETGWKCTVVYPKRKEKLYCQIFGRGVTPIHPSFRKGMRWCTALTKVIPMKRYRKTIENALLLNGVRWNESAMRDSKLEIAGCQAGGECGTNFGVQKSEGENLYSPIVNWTTCQVIDWLHGIVDKKVREHLQDFYSLTQQLIDAYGVKIEPEFGELPAKVKALRFGCIGCPAISKDKTLLHAMKENEKLEHLTRIHAIWNQLWLRKNRLEKMVKGKLQRGPIRMEMRKKYFKILLEIQESSGVEIVTPEDIRYIHKCWKREVYPKGWSKEDENGNG